MNRAYEEGRKAHEFAEQAREEAMLDIIYARDRSKRIREKTRSVYEQFAEKVRRASGRV